MPDSDLQSRTETVRAFNRFYTKAIGVLEKGYLHSPFSLTEVRVFYELRHREGLAAAAMGRELGLDPGYLSRLLARFEAKGYLRREASPDDARQSRLFLTEHGLPPSTRWSRSPATRSAACWPPFPGRAGPAAGGHGNDPDPAGGTADRGAGWLLRPHRPGDFGWIVQRHGEIYSAEYGWDQRFEGVVAGIAADIIASFDPATDACWIAEKDGRRIGSVAVVAKTPALAQLRILIVDAEARGLGVGRRLVAECITFARRAGFARMTLSTYSCLAAARGLYQQAGFQLEQSVPERSYGQDLVAETWTLAL